MNSHTPPISIPTIRENIKAFCDNALGTREFENWVYSIPALEAVLGPDLYLETISTDFSKQTSTTKIKKILQQWLQEGHTSLSIEHIEDMRSSFEERLDSVKAECKRLLKEKDDLIINTLREKSAGFPSIARALSNYETLADFQYAYLLKRKTHPAVETSKKISKLAKEKRHALKKLRVAVARIDYYENLFPWLSEYIDIDIDTLLDDVTNRVKGCQDDTDPIRKYFAEGEYEKLGIAERNQLALERYWIQKKQPWQLGRDYERYIGYLYEQEGYDVCYFGVEAGLGDLGRDLICSRNSEVLVVQCKYWSSQKTIHEKHISQLFGTTVMCEIEHQLKETHSLPQLQFRPVFVTSTSLSKKAIEFAKYLQVEVRQGVKFVQYPCVKCNIIGHNGAKIYHLPMDQQYDRLITTKKNRFYLKSAIEAERQGFRRAWKWHGDPSTHIG